MKVTAILSPHEDFDMFFRDSGTYPFVISAGQQKVDLHVQVSNDQPTTGTRRVIVRHGEPIALQGPQQNSSGPYLLSIHRRSNVTWINQRSQKIKILLEI